MDSFGPIVRQDNEVSQLGKIVDTMNQCSMVVNQDIKQESGTLPLGLCINFLLPPFVVHVS